MAGGSGFVAAAPVTDAGQMVIKQLCHRRHRQLDHRQRAVIGQGGLQSWLHV